MIFLPDWLKKCSLNFCKKTFLWSKEPKTFVDKLFKFLFGLKRRNLKNFNFVSQTKIVCTTIKLSNFLENSSNSIIRSDVRRLLFRLCKIAVKEDACVQRNAERENRSREDCEETREKKRPWFFSCWACAGEIRGHSRRGRKLRKADTVITEERAI